MEPGMGTQLCREDAGNLTSHQCPALRILCDGVYREYGVLYSYSCIMECNSSQGATTTKKVNLYLQHQIHRPQELRCFPPRHRESFHPSCPDEPLTAV